LQFTGTSLHPKGDPLIRNSIFGRHTRGLGWDPAARKSAIRRANLDPKLTPHDLRHSWASWHYALHRDLLALKTEGGWSSVALVERYAHLLLAGHQEAIRQFLGGH
jgi:integrase